MTHSIRLSIIVAVSENGVIGVDQELPWHLPRDLAFFKSQTKGHALLMGRKTYESIGRPLPGRFNLVLTKSKSWKVDGTQTCDSLEDAIRKAGMAGYHELFIIGGATLYEQFFPFAERLFITRVHAHINNGTAFFPYVSFDKWQCVQSDFFEADEKNQYACTFEIYHKKN